MNAILLAPSALATEDAPLSDPLGELISPLDDTKLDNTQLESISPSQASLPVRNDVSANMLYQTPVKFQGSRNTCTVFALTGVIESIIQRASPGSKAPDLSEQWLQYLAALGTESGGAKGSTVALNFSQLKKYGIANEAELPYDTSNWTGSTSKAARICAGLETRMLAQCLSSQIHPALMAMDDGRLLDSSSAFYAPDFVQARRTAKASRKTLGAYLERRTVQSVSEIKQLLNQGHSLALEINVYFGSWNHSAGKRLGIDMDPKLFKSGVITYPERGSVDHLKSPEAPARHAVVIFGYDDEVELNYTKEMANGEVRSFRRTGVYYFKNSWDKSKFGRNFKINGNPAPGFGMISQDYANQFGQFTHILWKLPEMETEPFLMTEPF